MKYLKYGNIYSNNIYDTIAGEILNMISNKQYFIDGVLSNGRIPVYNKIETSFCEYTFVVSKCNVIMTNNDYTNCYSDILYSINKLKSQISIQKKIAIKSSTYTVNKININMDNLFTLHDNNMLVNIIDTEEDNMTESKYMDLLSTIIVDNDNLFIFKHNYHSCHKSIKLTDFTHGISIKSGKLKYHDYYSSHYHIYMYFNGNSRWVKEYNTPIKFNKIYINIHAITWKSAITLINNETPNIITCNDKRCNMPLYDLIYVYNDTLLCPICVHNKFKKSNYIIYPLKVTQHPNTINDVVNSMDEQHHVKEAIIKSQKCLSYYDNAIIDNSYSYYTMDNSNLIMIDNVLDKLIKGIKLNTDKPILSIRIFN